MAHGDVVVGPDRAQDFGGAQLVGGVGIGVQEVDDDGVAALGDQPLAGGPDGVFVQRSEDFAGGIHALGNLEAQVAGDQGAKFALHPVSLRPCASAEFEHVAEAQGGDEAGFRQLAFQHGVGRGGGAVDDEAEGGQVAARRAQGVQDAEGLIVERARDLGEADAAGGRVKLDQIGEGAPDIDSDNRAGGLMCHDRSGKIIRMQTFFANGPSSQRTSIRAMAPTGLPPAWIARWSWVLRITWMMCWPTGSAPIWAMGPYMRSSLSPSR